VLLHPLFELLDREVGELQREGGKGREAVGVLRAELGELFVLDLDDLGHHVALGAIPRRVDAEHLHIDAELVHLAEPALPYFIDPRTDRALRLQPQQSVRLGYRAVRVHVDYPRAAAGDQDLAALSRRLRLRARLRRAQQTATRKHDTGCGSGCFLHEIPARDHFSPSVVCRFQFSAFTFASTMILANFFDSSLMNSRNCSGVPGAGSKPSSLSRADTSAVLNACPATALSRRTMGSGVPAGAKKPKKFTRSKPASGGYSAIAGMSGIMDTRAREVTAIGLTLPPSISGSAAAMLQNVMVMCFPATSATCGAAPLYGTCRICTPAILLKSSPVSCWGLPMPLEEQVSLFGGKPFAYAISSGTFFARTSIFTT